jgi:hypothetical protein
MLLFEYGLLALGLFAATWASPFSKVIGDGPDLESRAMLWQLSADLLFKMPEGYANRPGPALDPAPTTLGRDLMAMQQGAPAPEVSTAYRTTTMEELRRWQVQEVVLGPRPGEDRVLAFLTAIIGTPPTQAGGVYLWRLSP